LGLNYCTWNHKKTPKNPPYATTSFQMCRRLPYPIKRSQRGARPNQRQRGRALEVFQRHYYYYYCCYGSQQAFKSPSHSTPPAPNAPYAPYCVTPTVSPLLHPGSLFGPTFPSNCWLICTGNHIFFRVPTDR